MYISLENLSPQMSIIPGIDQLCVDAHMFRCLGHRPLNHRVDVKFTSDFGQLLAGVLVVHGRCARDDSN
jgi:hypothetical protein